MKKILLFSGIALSGILANAQIISNDNFNSADFTVGPISQAGYPATGQKGWQVASSIAGTSLDDFKIETLNGRKVATVAGVANASGGKFLLKQSFVSGWDNRTEFNDVLSVEFDVYTGTANPNTENTTYYRILGPDPKNPASSATLNSFFINHKDLKMGLGYYSNVCDVIPSACTNNPAEDINDWLYTFTDPLPANKWLKVGLAYDYNTAEIWYKVIDAATGEEIADEYLPGVLANSNINEIGVLTHSGTGSKAAAKAIIGSFKVYASDEEQLLAVNDIAKSKVSLSLFPNPATDFLNIDAKSKVESVQVYDMSGKAINSSVLDNKVDVRNLSKGTYIIKVKTVEGETTQKFIKN